MASPIKLPASTQDAPLSSLPPRPASSNSHSASANPLDNLDGPLNMQRADSAGSSPLVRGIKRGRDEGNAIGEGVLSQHRRSTRNPRIGLGRVFTIDLMIRSK